MDSTRTNSTTVQDAKLASPTLCERIVDAAASVGIGAKTALVVGGVLVVGGAYWLYCQLSSSSDESGDASHVDGLSGFEQDSR